MFYPFSYFRFDPTMIILIPSAAWPFMMIGLLIPSLGSLMNIGILLFGMAVLFQIIRCQRVCTEQNGCFREMVGLKE